MKRLMFLIAVIFIFGSTISEARDRVNFNYFYSSLRPYGHWIEIDYDVYAWKPAHVSRHWAPYKTGRWVWSDYGWYWDSYEPYGWAVYHYGRWFYDDYYGWIWIPDYEWAPAWVEWRYDDDYIGWAPLPPYAIFDIHIGIHFTNDWHFPHNHWHYVKYNHFTSYDIDRHYVPEKYKYRIHARSKHRNDYDYRDGRIFNRGVDKNLVEKRSGSRIDRRNLTEVSRLRDNDGNRSRDRERVEIFRPGDDEIRKSRDIEKFDIKRSDKRTSLDVSKVRTREKINTGREERSSEVKRNDDSKNRNDRVEKRKEDSRREDSRNTSDRKVEERKREDRNSGNEMRKVEVPQRNKVEQNTPREEKREVRNREEKHESPRIESRERKEPERRVQNNTREDNRESSRRESGNERTKERTRR